MVLVTVLFLGGGGIFFKEAAAADMPLCPEFLIPAGFIR